MSFFHIKRKLLKTGSGNEVFSILESGAFHRWGPIDWQLEDLYQVQLNALDLLVDFSMHLLNNNTLAARVSRPGFTRHLLMSSEDSIDAQLKRIFIRFRLFDTRAVIDDVVPFGAAMVTF